MPNAFITTVTRRPWLSAIIAIAVIGAGYFFFFRSSKGTYTFITVKKGPITEIVSVTGNTAAGESLNLAFEDGGTIASVEAPQGRHVSAGQVLTRLDTRDLQANLAQAQADVDTQTAKLRSLQDGAQPADIAASRAAVAKATQDLANIYANVANTVSDAYAKANDAVRNQLSAFFSAPETNNPQLTFSVSNSQTVNNVIFERIQASTELNAWQPELASIGGSGPTGTLDVALAHANARLGIVKSLLTGVSLALVSETGLPSATLDTYRNSLATAQSEVNTVASNVNSATQAIASQKITVAQLQAELDLKVAGATPSDIAAQEAQVEHAQANADSIKVKIAKASLTSPISGVVTVQNAKVGQIATPGAVLVSVISEGNLEVDANVPETDIGKVAVGNPVTMTFDAFPNESFSGKVFYIDPAETVIQGVVDYKIKISFDTSDSRIKSGLTANLDIHTREKNDALVLPQFAILQNDQGNFVETLANGKVTNVPVTLGIRDDKGNVEVLSGVTEGEEVLNIGLKQGS